MLIIERHYLKEWGTYQRLYNIYAILAYWHIVVFQEQHLPRTFMV